VVTTFFDPDYLTDNRGYTWQIQAAVERELNDNLGLSISYYRTSHFNQTVTDNTLVTPADFDEFSVVVPAGLPGAGSTIGGLYEVDPSKFGQIRNLVRAEETFGDKTEVFDGIDIGVNSRFAGGAIVQGGVAFGRTVVDNCFVVDNPTGTPIGAPTAAVAGQHFCRTTSPWWDGGGQIKFAASYPLPFGVEVSAIYQNLPGQQILANGVFTSAEVIGLGRPLNTPTISVPLIEPYTEFEERINQIDFRLGGVIRTAVGRVRLTLDLFNMLNANTVLLRNNTFSAAASGRGWGTPTTIMAGRLLKIGAQFSF
jgi:hypothetical protein